MLCDAIYQYDRIQNMVYIYIENMRERRKKEKAETKENISSSIHNNMIKENYDRGKWGMSLENGILSTYR